jgi:hypothetical protein
MYIKFNINNLKIMDIAVSGGGGNCIGAMDNIQ